MNILMAGASGLIGRELIKALHTDHNFTVLGRHKDFARQIFSGRIVSFSWDELEHLNAQNFDVVINLCGFNVAASRWSPEVKQEIISSRVQTTECLVDWVLKQGARPHIYCANAVGIYGAQDSDESNSFDEDTAIDFDHPKDFLSEVGVRWQQALAKAEEANLAVTTTRFGVVLKKGKGFLAKLYPSYICGLGSVIGDGREYLSWIDSEDLVNAYRFLLNNPQLVGPINITSPNPCMQKEFAKAFAHSLRRPLLLNMPTYFTRLLFGEMGDCLINHGQKVLPKRLLDAGFKFKWTTIQSALEHSVLEAEAL